MTKLEHRVISILAASALLLVCSAADTVRVPKKLDSTTLPNAYQLTDRVISGGQPDGDAAFQDLKKRGVKTVISVDGAKPDVLAAEKQGLRYVHLPHGYDGISDERLEDLAKAVRDLPGPIYIHCHHGKHRSPAAAAAACVSVGALNNEEALDVLKTAGTSPAYRGLYQAVAEARSIDNKELDSHQVEFRESLELPPMADAMVTIEHTHDHLKQIGVAGWKATADHPDIDPAHEALLLREAFTELLRTDEVKRKPRAFIESLKRSESDAQKLEDGLRAGKQTPAELCAVFARITSDCKGCHQQFRDIPLKEKNAVK